MLYLYELFQRDSKDPEVHHNRRWASTRREVPSERAADFAITVYGGRVFNEIMGGEDSNLNYSNCGDGCASVESDAGTPNIEIQRRSEWKEADDLLKNAKRFGIDVRRLGDRF